MEKDLEIQIIEESQAVTEYSFDRVLSPGGAIEVANTIAGYAKENKLITDIKGKPYAQVEAWQYAGLLLGLFPRVVSVENQSTEGEFKYRAEVEIVDTATGERRGYGIGICSNKESKKKYFDEYAVCSMAQTRAMGKAFRMLVGWMFKLAGMEPTPAEELDEQDPKVSSSEPTARAVLTDFKKFALRSLEACQTAADVEALVKLAPHLREDAKFIDTARARYKALADVAGK